MRVCDFAGVVYRYARTGPAASPWRLQGRLSASDFEDGAQFGASLATDGRDVLVGAQLDGNLPREPSGAAYLLDFQSLR